MSAFLADIWQMCPPGFQTDPWLLLLAPYVISQPLLRQYFASRNVYEENKPFCKSIMAFYNVFMSVFSAVCATTITYCLVFTIPGKSIYDVGHFAERTGAYERIVYVFYLSKYVEFLDTYFLILMKRPVSYLQWIHHIGAPIGMGLLYHAKSDMVWVFVGFNGFIHTIMYFYYAACIWSWKMPGLLKRSITSMQLLQFVSGLSTIVPYPWTPAFWADPGKRLSYYYMWIYVLVLIALFGNFFLQNYIAKAPKKK